MSGERVEARCFGVLGDPVGHSRSPAMQNAAFAALGLPHRYFPFHVAASGLAQAVAGARALGLGGLNVTVPHKQAIIPYLDRLSPEAARIGAVNTVVAVDGELVGHNTDAGGFLDALGELGGGTPTRAVVLGGGGAARAVIDALCHVDAPAQVVWVSRDPAKLPALQGVVRADYGELNALLPATDLLVNATSVGMVGGPAAFTPALPVDALRPGARVVDLVYPRPPAGLLDQAERVGALTQDGLPILLRQGVRALGLWLGAPVPAAAVEAMGRALQS